MGLVSKWQKKKAKQAGLDEAKATADKIISEAYDDYFKQIETVWLYGIRQATKQSGDAFGKERLERIYWTAIAEYQRMINRYQYGDDDTHYFVMEQELKDIGIDIKALQEEAEQRYPNGVKREHKRWGEE